MKRKGNIAAGRAGGERGGRCPPQLNRSDSPGARTHYKGEAMATIEEIAEQLDKLSLLDAAKLSKLLQEKRGVSAAAPVAVAAMPGSAGWGGGAGAPVRVRSGLCACR